MASRSQMASLIAEAQRLTMDERAIKIQEKKQSGQREDKDYIALLYSVWEGSAVAVPDNLRCTNCAGKRECLRATVAGSLEHFDRNGEKVYRRGLLWQCLSCCRHSQTCQVVYKDEQGQETTLTYQGLSKSRPPFPVQGFVLEGKPRVDAPEHQLPFLGKSKADAFSYIEKIRSDINDEALAAVNPQALENPRTAAERARFAKDTRKMLREMESTLSLLNTKVQDFVSIIDRHRSDDAFGDLCQSAKKELFKGIIKLCRLHDDVTYHDVDRGQGDRLLLIRLYQGSEQDAIDGAIKGIKKAYKRFTGEEMDLD